MHLKGLKFRS